MNETFEKLVKQYEQIKQLQTAYNLTFKSAVESYLQLNPSERIISDNEEILMTVIRESLAKEPVPEGQVESGIVEVKKPDTTQSNRYVIMPYDVIRNKVLTSDEKVVFANIMSRYKFYVIKGRTLYYKPYDQTLANECGMTIEQVLQTLHSLVKHNLILAFTNENGERVIEPTFVI